jgi:hypothetical protein
LFVNNIKLISNVVLSMFVVLKIISMSACDRSVIDVQMEYFYS